MKSNTFPSHLGFVEDTVPDDIFDFLLAASYEAKKDESNLNHTLVGNLEESYSLDLPFYQFIQFEKYLLKVCNEYENKFKLMHFYPIISGDRPISLSLKTFWVNFQKKYEFNPVHHHTGFYSFVIWVKIPYDYREEFKTDFCKNATAKYPGTFSFYFPNNKGQVEEKPIFLDKSFEKKIVVFPSTLSHCVYPFYTSDDYRISISGNLYLDLDGGHI